MTEDAVTIAQQVTRRGVPGKGLPHLMSRPFCSRMSRDGEVNNSPALVRQHEKHVEDLKTNRLYGKEID